MKSTFKHTPGPWVAVHIKPLYVMPDGSCEIQAGNVLVASMPSKSTNPAGYRKRRANARLIAAAPELLEALRRLSTETQLARKYIVISEDEGFDAYQATAKALIDANDVIAKATASNA